MRGPPWRGTKGRQMHSSHGHVGSAAGRGAEAHPRTLQAGLHVEPLLLFVQNHHLFNVRHHLLTVCLEHTQVLLHRHVDGLLCVMGGGQGRAEWQSQSEEAGRAGGVVGAAR